MKKIASIGSYNTGITIKMKALPSLGETLIGEGYSESPGGKGANQAVAAAKLGAEVTFIGSLGQDTFGADGLKMLKHEGVNTDYVLQTSEKKTGVGLVLLNEDNDNSIIVDLGANKDLTPEYIESVGHVISQIDIVLFQLESPVETVKKGMEIAKSANKTIIFNPAPATVAALELLSFATIVNPNESELKLLTGYPLTSELSAEKCKELARKLLTYGPECVIVTRGAKGAMFVTAEESGEVPGISVEVVDTTGAGDSFTGALAVALAQGKGLNEAIRFANLVGAYTVKGMEVVQSLPTLEQLRAFNDKLNKYVSFF